MSYLYSTTRKRVLSGWLKSNFPREFESRLKLQKFLFFYETASKIYGDNYEYIKLKGYKNGPVFSDIYADYYYSTEAFVNNVELAYDFSTDDFIDENRAKKAAFLISIMTEEELSDLTHEFNIWKAKEREINNGGKQIALSEDDFTQEDVDLMARLMDMYSNEYIESVHVLWVVDKCFIISKDEFRRLTVEHRRALLDIALEDDIMSPSYLTLSEDGVLLVD